MNETLRFSWGHIIAFLALLLVSYFSFMGLAYLTNGNFTFALIGMVVIDLVYLAVFIGAQILKAQGVKMERKIRIERVVVLSSPLIFVAGMIFMAHFFTVHSQEEQVKKTFKASIDDARQLFADYEDYAASRMQTYHNSLASIISNQKNTAKMKETGFVAGKEKVQMENMEETLRLQLHSSNYNRVKESALRWIDNAQNGATTWNVFILGNTKEIKETIINWENQLREFSSKKMSNEEIITPVAEFSSSGARSAIDGLDRLTASFTTQKFPTAWAILFGIVVYAMLLLPYLLQRRHTKSLYMSLFKKKDRDSSLTVSSEEVRQPNPEEVTKTNPEKMRQQVKEPETKSRKPAPSSPPGTFRL